MKRAVVRLERVAHYLAASGGEIESEGRAGRGAVFEMEKAAVFPVDRMTDRQAKARRRLLGGEIGIEDFVDQLRWHAGTIVGDRYLNVAPSFQWQSAPLVDL